MILGIDTSLGTAVAVIDPDGLARADILNPDPRGHAEVIGSLLRQALDHAALGPLGATGGAEPVALTAVAAGMGPGPFTGLRVGIAAARAFALGRGIPVIPVASHDAAALGALFEAELAGTDLGRFAVVTDARRRELAYSIYEGIDDDGIPHRVAGPALAPATDLDAVLAEAGALRRDTTVIPATMLALVAARAVAAGREVAASDPLYLRQPDVAPPAPRKKVGL